MKDVKDRWAAKVAELRANRDGRTPKDRLKEERIIGELEALFFQVPEDDRSGLERPEAPVYKCVRVVGHDDCEDLSD